MHLAKFIDHTLLRADAAEADIAGLCDEAMTHGFHSVCVNGSWVSFAAQRLRTSNVRVAAVTGFPLGAMQTETKTFETGQAVTDGAMEIDTVMSIGRFKSGDDASVLNDLKQVVQAADGRIVKAILETCLLTDDEIVRACGIAVEAGVHFVKTSTGFSTGGATVAQVCLMKNAVGHRCEVKASGGIRDRATALALIEAGATRLGTSSGIAILAGDKAPPGY